MSKNTPGKKVQTLEMKFDPNTIEHLGIHQYSTLPPVIAELVSNSYDAEAEKVEVHLEDREKKEIIIADDGHGMSYKEINDHFLKIGRNRRKSQGSQKSKNGKRDVIGKKGIGKLAFFGISKEIEVQTIQNGFLNSFKMNWDKLKEEGETGNIYQPKPLKINEETSKQNGTKVILKRIKRKSDFNPNDVAYSISKYFSVFDLPDFNVQIIHNGDTDKAVTVTNELKYKNIEIAFEKEFPLKDDPNDYEYSDKISGRIIAGKDTVPSKFEGIALFSRGKLVNEHSYYEVKASSHGYKYITGWLSVNFIDDWDKEVIATNRKSLIWEDEDAKELSDYLSRVIQDFYNEHREWKKNRKKEKIKEKTGIDVDDWIQQLPKHDRNLAEKIIKPIIDDDGLNEEKSSDLISYIKDSFEFESFKELAAEIAEIPEIQDDNLINLLKDWELIEAKEFYKLSLVRVNTIKSFERYINENAKEVPTLHDFLKTFPWLLDPRIMEFRDEISYSKLLKEEYPNSDEELEKNRRIDFLCTSLANNRFVIELKRPKHRIRAKDIKQARDYRSFIQSHSGNEPQAKKQVVAYIVCGDTHTSNRLLQEDIETWEKEGKIYIRTYSELLEQAKKYHLEFIDRFEALEKNISK